MTTPTLPREHSFVDRYGVEIVYDEYEADASAPARGVVQLLHGVGEHARRYGVLADHLTARGFHVYADDHRGHGRTGMRYHGDADKLGRLGPGGIPAARDAVHALTHRIRDAHADLPLVLLGHSWGSFLSQMLIDDHSEDYDALVLSGSALRWPGSLNAGDLNAPWKAPDALGTEWISREEDVQHGFLEDDLSTTEPLLKLFGPLNALRLFGRPSRRIARPLPTLLMVGSEDTVGGPKSVQRLADAYRSRAGFTDVTTLVYPGARHEIFNETNAAEVRADLTAWLDARIPPR